MFRVLVVDDDPDINEVVQEGLRSAGYDTVGALTGAEALAEVARLCPDLVLLDQMLPDRDGRSGGTRARAGAGGRRLHREALQHARADPARGGGAAAGDPHRDAPSA